MGSVALRHYAWVINRSVLASRTQDPLLRARRQGEAKQIEGIAQGLSQHLFAIAFQPEPPVGVDALRRLL